MLKKIFYVLISFCIFSGLELLPAALHDLESAVLTGDTREALAILKQRKKEIDDINSYDLNASGEMTILHYAAELGRHKVVEALLNAGADYTLRDEAGRLPVQIAINGNHPQTLRILLRYMLRYEPGYLNSPDEITGETLLHEAIRSREDSVMRVLVEEFEAQITQDDIDTAARSQDIVQLNRAHYLRQRSQMQQSLLSRAGSLFFCCCGGSRA